jgi:transcriptional regulator with XRE-family HTH domain
LAPFRTLDPEPASGSEIPLGVSARRRKENTALNTRAPFLAAWRARHLIGVVELGKRTGVAPSTIIRIERGVPGRLITLVKLANGIGHGVTPSHLIKIDPDQV